jgi:hypothetical protein
MFLNDRELLSLTQHAGEQLRCILGIEGDTDRGKGISGRLLGTLDDTGELLGEAETNRGRRCKYRVDFKEGGTVVASAVVALVWGRHDDGTPKLVRGGQQVVYCTDVSEVEEV